MHMQHIKMLKNNIIFCYQQLLCQWVNFKLLNCSIARCSLLVARYSLLVARCLLFVVRYSLFVCQCLNKVDRFDG